MVHVFRSSNLLSLIFFFRYNNYDIDESVQLVCKYLRAYDNRNDTNIGINKVYNEAGMYVIVFCVVVWTLHVTKPFKMNTDQLILVECLYSITCILQPPQCGSNAEACKHNKIINGKQPE